MEDYYKNKCEELEKKLSKEKRESFFYRQIAYTFCGASNALFYILIWGAIYFVGDFIIKNWFMLSVSDKVAIFIFISTLFGAFLKYKNLIFNWPEELFHRSLRREKEKEEVEKL
ncbi:MAG: hypothetical protein R3B64_02550 [Candidatus Paceibacterota bacterium]|nr:hypothetical protein [Candidatus Nomurabacteria bacterium]